MSQFSKQNSIAKRPRGAQPGNLNALKHGRYLISDHLPDVMPLDPAHFSDLGQIHCHDQKIHADHLRRRHEFHPPPGGQGHPAAAQPGGLEHLPPRQPSAPYQTPVREGIL